MLDSFRSGMSSAPNGNNNIHRIELKLICEIQVVKKQEQGYELEMFFFNRQCRELNQRIFQGLGKKIDWVFLEVHAEGVE